MKRFTPFLGDERLMESGGMISFVVFFFIALFGRLGLRLYLAQQHNISPDYHTRLAKISESLSLSRGPTCD